MIQIVGEIPLQADDKPHPLLFPLQEGRQGGWSGDRDSDSGKGNGAKPISPPPSMSPLPIGSPQGGNQKGGGLRWGEEIKMFMSL